MLMTVSVPPHVANVAEGGDADKPAGQPVLDAIYNTVHGFPLGTQELAARMHLSRDVLQQKANRNNPQHVFHPQQLVDLMRETGSAEVLHVMAQELGYTVMRALPDQSGADPVEAFMAVQAAFGDLVRAAGEPLVGVCGADPRPVTANEARRCAAMAGDLHSAVDRLVACIRGRVPASPRGGA